MNDQMLHNEEYNTGIMMEVHRSDLHSYYWENFGRKCESAIRGHFYFWEWVDK